MNKRPLEIQLRRWYFHTLLKVIAQLMTYFYKHAIFFCDKRDKRVKRFYDANVYTSNNYIIWKDGVAVKSLEKYFHRL